MTTTTPPEIRRAKERDKYVALASKPGSRYGSICHGRAAMPMLRRLKPRFVVDFGCGRNDFIRELRRWGIDGLGIDFAFPEADVVAPMHRTGLLSGVADAVTSFDALEHLLPEDVDETLSEMWRVAKPGGHLVVSICTRPSRTTVGGEGLHPTVRPLEWWLGRIGRVARLMNPRAGRGEERRFIVGRFKDAAIGGHGNA